MKRFSLQLLSLVLALSLGACASKIKLDEVPVSDAQPTSAKGQTATDPLKDVAVAAPPILGTSSRDVANNVVGSSAPSMPRPAGVNSTVLFDYDSFTIRPEFQPTIDGHAKYLNANRDRKVALEGHTDERGGREYNLALGQKRAEAVTRALKLLGVVDGQVEAVSFGKEKPAAVGADESVWAKNRRAEVFYR